MKSGRLTIRVFVCFSLMLRSPAFSQSEPGLLLHYPLDGNAAEVCAGADAYKGDCYYGELHGTTPTEDACRLANGAFRFEGDDHIRIGCWAKGSRAKPAFPATVSIYLKLNRLHTACIFRNDSVDHGNIRYGLAVFCSSSGTVTANYYCGYSRPENRFSCASLGPELSSGVWHHIVVAFKGSRQIRIYIDGKEVAPEPSGSASNLCYSNAYYGALGMDITSSGKKRYFEGDIADVRLYGRELTPFEIRRLYDDFQCPRFLRGDCNDDGKVNISDALSTLRALFPGGESIGCGDACDSNDDGEVDISDAIATLGVLFLSRGSIPPPGMEACGVDPTVDKVSCDTYGACVAPDDA